MPDPYTITQHDLEPPFEFQLVQAAQQGDTGAFLAPDGSWVKPIDLSTAVDVYVVIRDTRGRLLLRRAAAITSQTEGRGVLVWVDGDTDRSGSYRTDAEIMWAGARPQTVGPLHLVIRPDNG